MTSRNFKGRLTSLVSNADPNSKEFKAALFKIGTLIRNYAVMEITRKGAVSEGFLRASIAFKIESSRDVSRVIVGAFGVKYARMVEYGGVFTDRMRRAMFASFREQGKGKRPSRGIIKDGYYKARPFIEPAFKHTQPQVQGILRNLVGQSGKVIS